MQVTTPKNNHNQSANRIMVALVAVALVMAFFSSRDDAGNLDFKSLGVNLATELIGAVITYFIIDRIVKITVDNSELKPQMIRRLENPERGVTWQALQDLEAKGWLQDGSLYGWFLQRVNFERADLRRVSTNGLGLYRCNLQDAKIEVEQLVVMTDLRRTTMPNGRLYDGRYCLNGDLNWALTHYGIDVNRASHEELAGYYEVSVEEYLEGQRWAKDNLAGYGVPVPDYLKQLTLH